MKAQRVHSLDQGHTPWAWWGQDCTLVGTQGAPWTTGARTDTWVPQHPVLGWSFWAPQRPCCFCILVFSLSTAWLAASLWFCFGTKIWWSFISRPLNRNHSGNFGVRVKMCLWVCVLWLNWPFTSVRVVSLMALLWCPLHTYWEGLAVISPGSAVIKPDERRTVSVRLALLYASLEKQSPHAVGWSAVRSSCADPHARSSVAPVDSPSMYMTYRKLTAALYIYV